MRREAIRFTRFRGWLLGPLLVAATPARAENPAYLQEALRSFDPGVPRGWAYSLRTERGNLQTVERCDPAKPSAGQWTLLLTDGRAPTAEELAKYAKFKSVQAGNTPAPFQKGDIEPGSLILVSEDAKHAEFSGGFRAQAANADKMLGHLTLRLRICKQPAHVARCTVELRQPYSPVLGVKMHELVADMSFSAPGVDRPSLPWRSTSHFRGRLLLVVPMEENLRLTYSDFAPAPQKSNP